MKTSVLPRIKEDIQKILDETVYDKSTIRVDILENDLIVDPEVFCKNVIHIVSLDNFFYKDFIHGLSEYTKIEHLDLEIYFEHDKESDIDTVVIDIQ